MTTVLVLPENIFNIEVYSKSTSFILNWTYLNFLNFHGRHPCKKKEVRINYFEEQKKPRIFFKIFQKTKISKPFAPFWTIQNLKFSLSTNHGCRHFFKSCESQSEILSKHAGPFLFFLFFFFFCRRFSHILDIAK